jgi:hypothetical protein
MDPHRFDMVTRSLRDVASRRVVVRALTGAGLGLWSARLTTAAPKRQAMRKRKSGATPKSTGNAKPKPKKGLCKRDGSKCRIPGQGCKKRFCLDAPFTIEAKWTQTADHDTYLFVPAENETTGPSPYIYFPCRADNSDCEEAYPFACVSGDVTVSGAEITTIHQVLPGTYEYWIELAPTTLAGELTIVLKDDGGRVVRKWTNPANPSQMVQFGWHVFDVDGATGRVTSIDNLADAALPNGAHDPATDVCPN